MTLIAHRDLSQASGTSILNPAGGIDAEAQVGTLVQGDGAIMTTASEGSGNILLVSARDLVVRGVQAGSGNIALISTTGNILDGGDIHTDVSGGGLVLRAAGSIGRLIPGSNALETSVNTVSASSGGGGIHLLEANSLSVGEVFVAVDRVNTDGTTSPVSVIQSDLITSENGSVELVTLAGGITITDGTTTLNGTGIRADGSGSIRIQAQGGGGGRCGECVHPNGEWHDLHRGRRSGHPVERSQVHHQCGECSGEGAQRTSGER